MIFNRHSELAGQHAYLSASKHHWVNYDDAKFDRTLRTALAAQRGTDLHDLAHRMIKLGVKLPRTQATLNMYVNDCIGFKMQPETILFYSFNAFGTADAISFRKNVLRIYDLKTGINPTSFRQLCVYAAFFCLEYGYKPEEIEIELRIYQNDEIKEYIPDPEEIRFIMAQTVKFDSHVDTVRKEEL